MKTAPSSPKSFAAMSSGLKHALCALSFFRARNQRAPRFAHATGAKRLQTVSRRADRARAARRHIALARKHGFRGSIRAALGVAV